MLRRNKTGVILFNSVTATVRFGVLIMRGLSGESVKVGDLVRYTPEGTIDDRFDDWYGLVVRMIPGTSEMTVIRWNKDSSTTTFGIRKKDLTVVKNP